MGQNLSMPSRLARSDFKARLWLIVLAGLAWRVGYVLVTKRHTPVWGDPFAYHYGANLLAQGKGFIDPLRYEVFGQTYPSAYHPPLYLLYLAAWSVVGVKSALGHRLVSCLLGSATVGLVGLLGRRLAGDRAGLIAALLAAAYPQLWLNDAGLLSETAAAFGVVLALLALDRFRERPTTARALLLGGTLALTALSRLELLILVPLLAVPVVIGVAGLPTARSVVAARRDRRGHGRAHGPVGRVQPHALPEARVPLRRPGRGAVRRRVRRGVLRADDRLLDRLPADVTDRREGDPDAARRRRSSDGRPIPRARWRSGARSSRRRWATSPTSR